MVERILYYPVIGLIYLVSLLPLRIHYAASSAAAFLLGKVFRYRASTVCINLARSFPELKYRQIQTLLPRYYRYMTDLLAEMLWAYSRSPETVARRMEFSGTETVREMFGPGKNIIAVLGHVGNWELFCHIGPYSRIFGIDLEPSENFFIYKRQHGLSDRIIRRLRSAKGMCTLLESAQVLRKLMENRNGKGIYFFIADQSPVRGARFGMDFLHQPTLMINGPEYMAAKLKLPVVYIDMERYARGKYRTRVIPVTPDASRETPGFVTRRFGELLEASIRRNPVCWLWSHRRWKRWLCEGEELEQYFGSLRPDAAPISSTQNR